MLLLGLFAGAGLGWFFGSRPIAEWKQRWLVRDGEARDLDEKFRRAITELAGATEPASHAEALVRELADLVPGARYEVIADAAHLPCIEQPARLAGLIAGFAAEPGQGR